MGVMMHVVFESLSLVHIVIISYLDLQIERNLYLDQSYITIILYYRRPFSMPPETSVAENVVFFKLPT